MKAIRLIVANSLLNVPESRCHGGVAPLRGIRPGGRVLRCSRHGIAFDLERAGVCAAQRFPLPAQDGDRDGPDL